jgi:hypothetical protein
VKDQIPEFVDQVLREWDSIAFFAYDNFESTGRGVVCLAESEEGTQAMYAPRDYFLSRGNHRIVQILDAYDPEREFVIGFDIAEEARTIRIRTREKGRVPKRVWFFEMLRRRVDAPEELPATLPGWFIEACERLEEILGDNEETDDGADPS